jgi:DNA (cytosine-5)-methyltransferase 1
VLVRQLTHGSLFAGIGGFDLGFERAGIKTVWQVEIDPFCRKVLEKHWPNVQRFSDIRECRQLPWCDVITGGFPCQPFSCAGERAGDADSRFLWPEMLRVVSELRPNFVVAENVRFFSVLEDGRYLDQVYDDLEAIGYETFPPIVVPACAVGAGHRRDRLWIIAHSDGDGQRRLQSKQGEESQKEMGASGIGETRSASDSHREWELQQEGLQQDVRGWAGHSDWWATNAHLLSMDDGISAGLDNVRGFGNAVVPQIAEWIGRRIVACHEQTLVDEKRRLNGR